MVGPPGIEPGLFRLSIGCFDQLSYDPNKLTMKKTCIFY